MPKSMRVRAKEAYIEFAKLGRPLPISDLADRSAEIFGEKVPYLSLRTWYKEDGWVSAVSITSFTGSEELRRTKALLDIAYDAITNADEFTTPKELSDSARMYLKIVRKLPATLISVIENDIVGVREVLFVYAIENKDKVTKSVLSTISGAWVDLEKRLVPELPIDSSGPTVDSNRLIMRQRPGDGKA